MNKGRLELWIYPNKSQIIPNDLLKSTIIFVLKTVGHSLISNRDRVSCYAFVDLVVVKKYIMWQPEQHTLAWEISVYYNQFTLCSLKLEYEQTLSERKQNWPNYPRNLKKNLNLTINIQRMLPSHYQRREIMRFYSTDWKRVTNL